MSSAERRSVERRLEERDPLDEVVDAGLLSPVRVGALTEAATSDRAWVRALLDAEAGLTRAQAFLGLVPARAATAVTAVVTARTRPPRAPGAPSPRPEDEDAWRGTSRPAARSTPVPRTAADAASRSGPRFAARELAELARAGGNPVIPLVRELTEAVREVDPGAADHVHHGATSQDILDTAAMLVTSRALAPVTEALGRTAATLSALATQHRATPMAGRTLTQHAVPTTFGLKVAGWHSLIRDALVRLEAVRDRLPVQLGGAAGTLAPWPQPQGVRLLGAYARELGLAEPRLPWHALRTPIADLAGALAFTAGALGKLAADVLVLSRTEIGELAEGGSGGSSTMPHQAHPVRATLIAASARQVPALAGVLYAALGAEDEGPAGAWHAEWQPLREALRLVGGAAEAGAALVAEVRVAPERMRANLELTGGRIVSERLRAALTPGLGRAEAERLVGTATRRATAERRPLGEVLNEVLHEARGEGRGEGVPEPEGADPGDPRLASPDPFGPERLAELLDPTGYLGSAPALVDRGLHGTAFRDARSAGSDPAAEAPAPDSPWSGSP